jgi:hypothetical protein
MYLNSTTINQYFNAKNNGYTGTLLEIHTNTDCLVEATEKGNNIYTFHFYKHMQGNKGVGKIHKILETCGKELTAPSS